MSRSRRAYMPAGSGTGHLQRVADDLRYNRVQHAYRAYIDHTGDCAACALDSTQCPTAGELWDAYRATSTNG